MKNLFLIALLFMLVACDNTASSPEDMASITPTSDLTVKIVGGTTPEYIQIREETVPQYNCGGNAEVDSVLEKNRSIRREIKVGSGLTINAAGKVGIAGTGVELGAEVASHLGFTYGVEENIARSLVIRARPGTYMSHVVRLIEVWEVGTAVAVIAGEVYEIPFKVRNDFALELKGSFEYPCPTPSPDNNAENSESNNDANSELPLVEVSHPQLFYAEENVPDGTSMKIRVGEGEIHAMTSGTICVASVCLPGGTDRGSVVVFLPSAVYDVTGLNPTYNWHGAYYADPDQWEIIADQLSGEQKIPGTCSDDDGCSIVDVVIVENRGYCRAISRVRLSKFRCRQTGLAARWSSVDLGPESCIRRSSLSVTFRNANAFRQLLLDGRSPAIVRLWAGWATPSGLCTLSTPSVSLPHAALRRRSARHLPSYGNWSTEPGPVWGWTTGTYGRTS